MLDTLNFTEYVNDHRCLSCIHAPVCVNTLGGADLDIAGKDCPHYLSAHAELPTKFWLIFNVPGFYNITEYNVERILYSSGLIEKIWGRSAHNADVVYAADFGRTVFFNRTNAEECLKRLIEEYRNEEK